jgi:exodeoxyribonuclease V gamma subunit
VLHIHRATRADALADALARLLSEPVGDPLAPDVVAVATRGMERWLTQRMSATLGASAARADGVCANVLFPTPHRLTLDAVAAASGIDPREDPWLPERAMWPLLEVVEHSLHEPWLGALATYLGAGPGLERNADPVRRARRLTVVRHLAGLFDRYARHRPWMVQAWSDGRDLDPAGGPLAQSGAWQAELWRRLRARIPVPDPAGRVAGACDRLRAEPELVELPERVSLFGLTRMPAGELDVLRALAAAREVHAFLLHPSPALWRAVGEALTSVPDATASHRHSDPTRLLARNRLLASWGRDARELQLVLAAGRSLHRSGPGRSEAPIASTLFDPPPGPPGAGADTDHGPAPDPGPTCLLARLQAEIRDDTPAPGVPHPGHDDLRATLSADDRSVQIHACHGRVRQVEVLRDAVLHALAEDPTLEPRDVIVMCPDVEAYAPLIHATFGAGERQPSDGDGPRPVDLRVRLADRSLRQVNPVLAVVWQLLELVGQRVTASQVLDIADREPVRRRFELDDDDLTRITDWVSQAGIRWGIDAAQRAAFKLGRFDDGTWERGLGRLLLGVTMNEDGQRLFGNVLPLDDVDDRSIDLAGRLTELVARLGEALRALSEPQTLAAWAAAIAQAADALTATAPRERWQRSELQRVLDELVAEAGGAPERVLAPGELRSHIAGRLEGRATRANFRTGHLTVCTLMPMRSVPHRVVCLLGLDDGAFPRKAPRDGDDLMLLDPLIGERDPRSEDRQLLLDALMAATERLIVTYTGNDERTNAVRPPAVPIGELLDAIDATVRTDSGAARDRVVIRHPLQPFDPRNFTPGALGGPGPWSFDALTLAGARALEAPRATPRPFLSRPLPPRHEPVVELADLIRFLEHPVRAFLRLRLGISLRDWGDELADSMPVELDGLERWGVGQRLLDARVAGVPGRTAALAEIARGTLPPGQLAKPVIQDLYRVVDRIYGAAAEAARVGAGGDPLDVRVELADGRVLTGTVGGVSGDVLMTTTFSRVSAKHRLAAWARLVALTASWPERALEAVTVGRARDGEVRIARAGPLAPDRDRRRAVAREQLELLVDLYDRGMREPLPIFCATSHAYAEAARQGQDAAQAARGEWETGFGFDREDRELEHQLVLGGTLTVAELLERAPAAGEDGPGWELAEGSRFGRYARRLWSGPLTHEDVSSR